MVLHRLPACLLNRRRHERPHRAWAPQVSLVTAILPAVSLILTIRSSKPNLRVTSASSTAELAPIPSSSLAAPTGS